MRIFGKLHVEHMPEVRRSSNPLSEFRLGSERLLLNPRNLWSRKMAENAYV